MAANEINKAFFSLNDCCCMNDDLLEENYEKIPVNDIHNSAFIIFNEQGLVQYASNETITEKVFFEDMDLLETIIPEDYLMFLKRDRPMGRSITTYF